MGLPRDRTIRPVFVRVFRPIAGLGNASPLAAWRLRSSPEMATDDDRQEPSKLALKPKIS